MPAPGAPHFTYSPLSGNGAASRPAPPGDPPQPPKGGAPPTEGVFPSTPTAPTTQAIPGGGEGGGGGASTALDPNFAPISDGGSLGGAPAARFKAEGASLSEAGSSEGSGEESTRGNDPQAIPDAPKATEPPREAPPSEATPTSTHDVAIPPLPQVPEGMDTMAASPLPAVDPLSQSKGGSGASTPVGVSTERLN